MPRIKDGIERATPEEIDAMAKQAKAEVKKEKAATPKALKTEGISPLETNITKTTEIGVNVEKKANPDKAIVDKFKFVPCMKKGWIPMTPDQAKEYSDKGIICGYDPINGIGKITKEQ